MTKLESALDLATRGLPVFPLIPNSKLPAIKNYPEEATLDPEKITKWWTQNPDFNIGISSDKFLIVDVDTKNPNKNGMETMARLNEEGKYFPPTMGQVTPTKGLHLIYDTPHPVKNGVSKIGPGIDTRGFHGYVVGAGSTLGGKKYRIDEMVRDKAPEWLLNICGTEAEQKVKTPKKAIPVNVSRARQQALAYLKTVETEEGSRNDHGYQIANRLKDLGLDPDEVILIMLDDWKCEPALDIGEISAIVKNAFTYGKEAQGSASPEASFEPITEELPNEGDPITNMNKEYALVLIKGKHVILQETTDHKGNKVINYINEDSFHKYLSSRKHQIDKKIVPLTRFWLDHPKRRSYKGIIFYPEQKAPEEYFNIWQGFGLKEVGKDEKFSDLAYESVRIFKEHLLENICGSDLDHFAWCMAWFAHLVQRPWEKPETALVLRGKKGVGKNAFIDCIRPFFPHHYMVAANQRYMTGNFNSHMQNKIVVVFDEAFWSGEKSADSTLKDLITGQTQQIEMKGKDPFELESCLRVVILSNEDWVIPASAEERRFAMFDVGNARIQDRDFFTKLTKGMQDGGNRILFTELRNLNFDHIDVKTAPKTEGLLTQKQQSLPPTEQWLFDSLAQGYFDGISSDFDSGVWARSADKNSLKQAYNRYCDDRNIHSWRPTDMNFLMALQKIIPDVKMVINKETNMADFSFPSLEDCRKSWDLKQGQKYAWDKR